ncbi:MAG: GDP-mannose 4,6-dehydratase [Acidobacteria bacterium]|nr:GDP-mannose 4,6-dehydratase [Acidobacteriota bacterium]
MRFFLTGISGFVGSRLTRHLLEAGDSVRGTYVGELPAGLGCPSFAIDLRDGKALAEAVESFDPDVVVHLGGLSHVGASWKRPAEYFQVNVLGTEVALEAAAGRRILIASSAEVYGRVPEEEQPIPADRPLAPQTPYALTKAAAERLAVARGAIVVSSFNAVGAGQASNFALPAFARQLAQIRAGEQEPVLFVGNLEARRDFVHIDDVARGYRQLALHGEAGESYNLATGKAVSIAQALERLVEISGLDVEVRQDPQRMRPVDVPLLCGDAGGLEALGWKPEKSLDDALDELWQAELHHAASRQGDLA